MILIGCSQWLLLIINIQEYVTATQILQKASLFCLRGYGKIQGNQFIIIHKNLSFLSFQFCLITWVASQLKTHPSSNLGLEALEFISNFGKNHNWWWWLLWDETNPYKMHLDSGNVTFCGLWPTRIINPWRPCFFQTKAHIAITVNGYRMIINFLWPKLDDMETDNIWFPWRFVPQSAYDNVHSARAIWGLGYPRVATLPKLCDLTALDFFLGGTLSGKHMQINCKQINGAVKPDDGHPANSAKCIQCFEFVPPVRPRPTFESRMSYIILQNILWNETKLISLLT